MTIILEDQHQFASRGIEKDRNSSNNRVKLEIKKTDATDIGPFYTIYYGLQLNGSILNTFRIIPIKYYL